MTCKNCGREQSKVVSSQPARWCGLIVPRRYRRCLHCDNRWYSLELPEDDLDTYITSHTEAIPRKKAADAREAKKPAWMRSQESSRRRLLGFKAGGEPDPEYSDLAEVQVRNYWED